MAPINKKVRRVRKLGEGTESKKTSLYLNVYRLGWMQMSSDQKQPSDGWLSSTWDDTDGAVSI